MFEGTKKLLTNNTGYSIKNWFLYGVTIVGILLLVIVGFVLVWDVLKDGTVSSNISDLATFIGSVAALFTAAGLPKIVGDIMENRNSSKSKKKGVEKLIMDENEESH